MQLVSTFAYVYFKDVSAPLESIYYLGPHAWYINLKEKEIKQARQKQKKEKKKKNKKKQKKKKKNIRTNTDTVCKGSIQQIIK